jgi:hypothetical protein
MALISLGKDTVDVIINGKYSYGLHKKSDERTLPLEDISVAKYSSNNKCWYITMKSSKMYQVYMKYNYSWFEQQFPEFPYSAKHSDDLIMKELIKINNELKKIRKYLKLEPSNTSSQTTPSEKIESTSSSSGEDEDESSSDESSSDESSSDESSSV